MLEFNNALSEFLFYAGSIMLVLSGYVTYKTLRKHELRELNWKSIRRLFRDAFRI